MTRCGDGREIVALWPGFALGLELTEETRVKMDRFRGANPKDKRGVHRYRAEDFGLDPERLDRDFASYRDYYGIAQESE